MAFTLKNIAKKTEFNKKPENQESYQKVTCVVTRYIYTDDENGFFVFQAQLAEGEPNVSAQVNGKTFAGRKFAVVGTSLLLVQAVVEGQEVEVWGNFEQGKQPDTIQFSASAIQEKIPTKPKAIELFLSSGKIYGIGPKKAKKIVTKYGARTIEILDSNPEMLLEVDGINPKSLEMMVQSWREWRSIYEIVATMRLYGVGDVAGVKIFNHFKENSLQIIKNEPYQLTEVPSIGFRTADKIAQSIGISPIDQQRIEKCILYTLEEIAEKGNTAYPKEDLAFKVNEILQVDPQLIDSQIENLITKDLLIPKTVKIKSLKSKYSEEFVIVQKEGVAHKKIHNTEARIAKELKRLMEWPILESQEDSQRHIKHFLDENPTKLDISQLEAAKNILFNKVSILTGGPGTGKTHTIKSLLDYFDSMGKSSVLVVNEEFNNQGGLKSVLCAPTGRAAKKMEEATGKSGATIHRLLGYKEGQFVFNENNKLKGDVFIVDESSMIDIWLMNAFLKALPSDARLIFVGDVDQLPSVGAGDVLKDMINSGKIPVSRLSVIHRQALNSNIIVAAHAIINKTVPPLFDLSSQSDFVFVDCDGNEEIHDTMMNIIADMVSKGIPHEDIQILTPKKESEVGTHKLNQSMRGILNPNFLNYQEVKSKFVPGDRVMQYKNNRELDIYNGDTGVVQSIDVDSATIDVKFDDKRIEFSGQNLSNLNLSYAITVHKSQGSDYPYVIIPLSKSHTFMWDVNLLYTAVTRGKKRVILVGEKKTLFYSVANFKQTDRITGLKDQIIEIFEAPMENNIKTPNPFG
jgi:exodeoxyribonuclease V alpha subunit